MNRIDRQNWEVMLRSKSSPRLECSVIRASGRVCNGAGHIILSAYRHGHDEAEKSKRMTQNLNQSFDAKERKKWNQ